MPWCVVGHAVLEAVHVVSAHEIGCSRTHSRLWRPLSPVSARGCCPRQTPAPQMASATTSNNTLADIGMPAPGLRPFASRLTPHPYASTLYSPSPSGCSRWGHTSRHMAADTGACNRCPRSGPVVDFRLVTLKHRLLLVHHAVSHSKHRPPTHATLRFRTTSGHETFPGRSW